MSTVVDQRDGEKVIITLRKNPIILNKQIFRFLLLVGLSVASLIYFTNQYAVLAAICVLLISLSYGFYHFLIWFYDAYIITTKRVVCVHQKTLFSREYNEADLETIQEVTYTIKGVIATIFQYGTVLVRTNTGVKLELTGLSDPDEVQDMIRSLAKSVIKKGGEPKKGIITDENADFNAETKKK
jgi:uncharacterized membrane protein YdbT with pleckstrin-like domain